MSWPLLSKGCGVYKRGQEAVCQQTLTATQESLGMTTEVQFSR